MLVCYEAETDDSLQAQTKQSGKCLACKTEQDPINTICNVCKPITNMLSADLQTRKCLFSWHKSNPTDSRSQLKQTIRNKMKGSERKLSKLNNKEKCLC